MTTPFDPTLPGVSDAYATLLSEIRNNVLACALWLGSTETTYSNLVTGTKRYNDSTALFEDWNGTSWSPLSLNYLQIVAASGHGSIQVPGSNGGYAGIQFSAGSGLYTVMVNVSTGYSGVWSETAAAWQWAFDASGNLDAGKVPWGKVLSPPAITTLTADTAATASTVAQRDSSGYLNCVYYNQSSSLESVLIGAVIVQNTAADGYFRKISIANFNAVVAPIWTNVTGKPTNVSSFTNDAGYITTSALSGYAQTASAPTFTGMVKGNSGSKGFGAITTTTSATTPSGGSSGDFVFQY